jgi:O-antigen/teichoic acid export membrane protein
MLTIKYWANRPLVGPAAGSLLAGIAGQVLLIGSGIALARTLGTTNRGYLALLLLWPAILEPLGAVGLPFATAFFIARDPFQTQPIARLAVRWWSRQSVYLVLAQCAILAVYLSHREAQLRPAAALSLVTIPATLAVDYSLAILQGQRQFRLFNVVRNLLPATACVASVGALLIGLHELAALVALLMIGYAVSAVTVGLVAWRTVRKWPPNALSTHTRDFHKFGRRAFIGSIYPFEAFRFDQLIVSVFFPAAALGLYVVAYAFTNLPRFVTQSLGMVAYPHIASLEDPRKQKASITRFALLGGLIALGVVVALEITMGSLVPILFGSQFVGSVQLARILLPGALFFALRRILAEGLKGAGHPAIGTAAEIAAWIAMVPLAALLIPALALQGVALAADGAALISLLTLLYLDWRGPRFAVGRSVPEPTDSVATTMP